jgi:hypothetical protein
MQLLINLCFFFDAALLLVLIYRVSRHALAGRYRLFFGYLLALSLSEVLRTYLRLYATLTSYSIGYWVTEFATSLIGFGVIWEIYRQAFVSFDGVRRLARLVLCSLTAMVFLRTAVALALDPVHRLGPTTLELIRNLQVVQALFLMGLGLLMTVYDVPLNRNIRSMLSGYGVYVGSMIIVRTAQSVWGSADNLWWAVAKQLAFCAALVTWCIGLWSDSRNPVPDMRLERDYERISGQTLRAFGQLRQHLIQSWRA